MSDDFFNYSERARQVLLGLIDDPVEVEDGLSEHETVIAHLQDAGVSEEEINRIVNADAELFIRARASVQVPAKGANPMNKQQRKELQALKNALSIIARNYAVVPGGQSASTYAPKDYTHHLKPNERSHDGDHWGWYVPGRKNLAYSMHRDVQGRYAVHLYGDGGIEARGSGPRPRDAYREAYRALRRATRHDLQDVFQELGDLRRKYRKLLAERAELLKKLQDVEQSSGAADLREGLNAVRLALAGTTLAAGQPLDARVRAVVERMSELDRLYTAEQRRVEELKRGQQHQAAVIAQLLVLVREAAGQDSNAYTRARSLAAAVHVTAPDKSEVPA